MNTKNQNKKDFKSNKPSKDRTTIKKFTDAVSFSLQGIKFAYTEEQNMAIHIAMTIITVTGGLLLKISLMEWLWCLVLIGLVLAAELFNTAIEATIDLLTQEMHPLAKIAKDTASAAVFILAVVAFTGGILIFLPKIIALF